MHAAASPAKFGGRSAVSAGQDTARDGRRSPQIGDVVGSGDPSGDSTSHAGHIVNELCVSAQISSNDLFEQLAAEPLLAWPRNCGAAAFLPIQVQHSIREDPPHTDTAFGG